MQEAFVKAYAALDRFRAGAPFRPWLLKIVANETRNLHRASGRRAAREQRSWQEAERLLLARPDDPAEATLSQERQEALVRGLARLSPPHRQVVTCRYLLDLDEAESAAVLGWPRGTVKSRLHRALARLRDVLDADAERVQARRRRTMAEHGYDDLARDLAALGRAVDVPAPGPGLASAVLERLDDAPAARMAPARPRRRLVALAVGAVLLALLATPPVRAAVADWFGFGGVRVERGGTPAPTVDPTRPTRPSRPDAAPGGTRRFLRRPRRWWASPVSVPEELGAPRRRGGLARPPDGLDELDHRRGGSAAPRPVRREAGLLRPQDGSRRLLRRGERAPTPSGSRSRTRSRSSSPTAPGSPTRPGSPGTP